jgi:NAD(P)H-hydrate repair Nnr-like enzyme with NAD(P)H-hydrate dehydratase domain
MILAAAPSVVVAPGRVNAWLLGPGIADYDSQDPNTIFRHRSMVLAYEENLPTVLDAGGLLMPETFHELTLLTPHAGELSRLLATRGIEASADSIGDRPLEWAQRAAEALGTTVLLKGSRTCVASPDKVIEMPLATPWLSTAGTGDVLAGVIGALAATHSQSLMDQPEYFADLAASGAYIHALAASQVSQGGPFSAEALVRQIPVAVREILGR